MKVEIIDFGHNWVILSYKSFGVNTNGLDWCKTLEEAEKIIKRFKSATSETECLDKIVEEKIHEI